MMKMLNETVGQTTRTATDNAHRYIDRTAEVLHGTAENVASKAVDLAERADHSADALLATEQKLRGGIIDYSLQHPLRSIVLGLGTGFVLAKLIGRRSRHVH